MFGGNSNWRGPIWMPVNALIIRALLQYYAFYGDDFTVECPTGSGRQMTLYEVAEEIARRLASHLPARRRRASAGLRRRPTKFQDDPHWRDHVLFYEYFHGDNGAGLGASHQTGWTGRHRAGSCTCSRRPRPSSSSSRQAAVVELAGRRRARAAASRP